MRMKLSYLLVFLAFIIAQPQAEAQLLWWKKKDKTENLSQIKESEKIIINKPPF